ncbi:hypothetical protein PHLCEN_2v3156 [Hermanssonia centrifuga]|uniref:FIT family protein scs3 n=1 Tax=Hermanssonia centrifuga TaxID=98765 RepID=A0A2R6R116_9APHY|nr:hypothetical protein PHLCEN_2v3156 [Hermanssonia centrifuga]
MSNVPQTMPPLPRRMLVTLTAIITCGTMYSVLYDTYLDTSNPLLTHLPHPLHHTHYFASKRNLLNVVFTKKLWAWTSAAFFASYFTSPPSARLNQRLYKYFAATTVWLLFTGWFFGPSLLDRLVTQTGGECFVHLPSGAVVSIPSELCYTKSTISLQSHPLLFPAALQFPEDGWSQMPRLRRGHDVSGHLFLLTLSVLFLTEQLHYSFASQSRSAGPTANTDDKWPANHKWAVLGDVVIIIVALFATYTTSIYFHTPLEKLTGFVIVCCWFAIV